MSERHPIRERIKRNAEERAKIAARLAFEASDNDRKRRYDYQLESKTPASPDQEPDFDQVRRPVIDGEFEFTEEWRAGVEDGVFDRLHPQETARMREEAGKNTTDPTDKNLHIRHDHLR